MMRQTLEPDHDLYGRIGTFTISDRLITDSHTALMDMFANCIIVRAEYRYDLMGFHYVALSPLFDVKSPEFVTPEYKPIFKTALVTENSEEPQRVTTFEGFKPTNPNTTP